MRVSSTEAEAGSKANSGANSGADTTERSDVVDLTVVIPAYNEQHRLAPTLEAITNHLQAQGTWQSSWELIVVDDGSTDDTRALVAAAAAHNPRIRLLTEESPRNRGKGHALRRGVLASRGRRILLTDADLAAPISELDRLAQALDAGHTAAIGSRARPGATIERRQHPLREYLGRAGNVLVRATTLPGIRDTQCGFKLFDGDRARTAFAASRLDGWGIDVEVLRHFRRAAWPVTEVPIRWAHQPGSKVRPLDYLRMLTELTRLRTRAVHRTDALAAALFLLLAVALYAGRWTAPNHTYLPNSLQDQTQWEWFFAVTADNVRHLHNPLFTTLQGYPAGVNLMANTAMLGVTVPFTPVTLLLGPSVALLLAQTLGIAATATTWYWLLLKRLVHHRPAAFTGAALAAFAPPMISHANAHPNFTVLFMIPLIIDRVLRLPTGQRPVRDGAVLGLMLTYQVFLGEEPLLLTAIGLTLFLTAYALTPPSKATTMARHLLKGTAIALAVSLPLLAFPLYWQFAGPQSYDSILHGTGRGVANSPRALLSFSSASALAGDNDSATALSLNPTEQNAFYGWPLALLATAIAVRLWRHPQVQAPVRALATTAAGAAWLSLGPRFQVPWTQVTVPGPWALLDRLPLFESVIESRVALVCAPALGALLALAAAVTGGRGRALTLTAVTAALLPIVPAPLPTTERPPVPAFFTDGTWRSYVDVKKGESLVPVPLPNDGDATALHWQTAAGLGFRLAGGYFNGPSSSWNRAGVYGAEPRYTSNVLREVRYTAVVPKIDAATRKQARADLAYWRAGALVLAPQTFDRALKTTVDELVGRKGKWIGGVWVWDLDGEGTMTTRSSG
ncbi:Dolichyl-phosphate beta-glucosyltransferase [Actinobacteria bacterium OK074]|nr:Dolichyl-phosphate beta-glucosyltransferase [Actinobacteria bacterium OK074]